MKEYLEIIAGLCAFVVMWFIFMVIMVGIPAAAIVWIIETLSK